MIWDQLEDKLNNIKSDIKRKRTVLDSPCNATVMVNGRRLISFCSNDYLGLANHPIIVETIKESVTKWGVGSGASHLISGHMRPHEDLEVCLSNFTKHGRTLFFTSGYMANLAMISSIVGRNDVIFSDRLNHASLIDGAVLSRSKHIRFPHSNLSSLCISLNKYKNKRKLIITDAVFSMDGDIARLSELYSIAEKFDTWLIIDDAHGFGILGPNGRGSIAEFNLPMSPRLLSMYTLGKAAGVSGAFIAGNEHIIEWIIQKARPYIFTTAPSPFIASAIISSIDIIKNSDNRRLYLKYLIEKIRLGLSNLPWRVLPSKTPIQPLVIGTNQATLDLSNYLFNNGFLVPAIRPPTVPIGTARLRISLSASHKEEHIDSLLEYLYKYAINNVR